jgi:hypothetical protein
MRLAFLMAGGMMVAAIAIAFRNPASTDRLP